jgi:hypothetical protein
MSAGDGGGSEVHMLKVMVDEAEGKPPDRACWVTSSRTGVKRLRRLGGMAPTERRSWSTSGTMT